MRGSLPIGVLVAGLLAIPCAICCSTLANAAEIGIRPEAPTSGDRVYFDVPVQACSLVSIASSDLTRVGSEIRIRVEQPILSGCSPRGPADAMLTLWSDHLPAGPYSVSYELASPVSATITRTASFVVAPESMPASRAPVAVLLQGPNTLALVDTRNDEVVERVVLPSTQGYNGVFEVSADGRFVYALAGRDMGVAPGDYATYIVQVIDLWSGTAPRSIPLYSAWRMAASYDDRYLYVQGVDGTRRIEFTSPALISTLPTLGGLTAVSAGGLWLYSMSSSGLVFQSTRDDTSGTVPLSPSPDLLSPIVVTPDGRAAYYVSSDPYRPSSTVHRIELPSGRIQWSTPLNGLIGMSTLSADGARLYAVGRSESALVAIDTATGALIKAVTVGNTRLDALATTPDDSKIYVYAAAAGITVVNASSMEVVRTIPNAGFVLGTRFIGPRRSVEALATEYFHAGFDHYFMTNEGAEIEHLDAGVIAGWKRTGQQIPVEPIAREGTVSVCRFFSTSFGPRSSHYYAPRGLGCAEASVNPDWLFEGEVFSMGVPTADGICGAGRQPVYRLYNNGRGGAPNHRFTTNASTRSEMIAAGWVPEGRGPGVSMCAAIP